MTLLVCDNQKIKKINCRYFGKNKPTDVIAFGMPKKPFVEERRYLGDIVVPYRVFVRGLEKYVAPRLPGQADATVERATHCNVMAAITDHCLGGAH